MKQLDLFEDEKKRKSREIKQRIKEIKHKLKKKKHIKGVKL